MTECVSSVLLLGRASKHTVLSVKIEDYEPLVAVPWLSREIIKLKLMWFPEIKVSFICVFKAEPLTVSWFV